MNIRIELKTKDIHVLSEILGNRDSFAGGEQISIPGNASLIYRGTPESVTASPITLVFDLVLTFGSDGDLVATWFTNRFSDLAYGVSVDGVQIELSENNLRRIIQDRFDQE